MFRRKIILISIIAILTLGISYSPQMVANEIDISADIISPSSHPTIDTYVIPISFVVDYFLFESWGINTVNNVESIFNLLNDIYLLSNITLGFSFDQIKVFTDETNNNNTFDYVWNVDGYLVNDLLTSFRVYATSEALFDTSENVVFLSGVDFESGVVGYAYRGNVNTPYSINQMGFTDEFSASLLAHEIGHNFDASHDGEAPNSCSNTGYIMSSSLSVPNPPTEFSSCSINEIQTFIETNHADRIDTTVPVIENTPISTFSKIQGSDANITWDISESGFYDLYKNNILIVDDQDFNFNKIVYDVDISTVQSYNLILVVYDLAGHSTSIGITVEIVGDKNPTVSTEDDFSVEEDKIFNVNWTITDDSSWISLSLYLDSQLLTSQNITSNQLETGYLYTYSISDILSPGTYNLTIFVMDSSHQNVSDTIFVEVLAVQDTITTTTSKTETVSSDTTITDEVIITASLTDNQFESILDNLSFTSFHLLLFTFVICTYIYRRRQ